MEKKSKLELALNIIVFAVQLGSSAALVTLLYITKFVPTNYVIAAGVVLAALLIGESFLIFYKKSKAKRSLITQIISLLLSIIMIVGCSYTYKFANTVNLVTSDSFQSRAISVMVLKNSEIKNQYNVKGHTYGIVTSLDKDTMDYAVKKINSHCGNIKTKTYKDLSALMKALYHKDVDGIILDEAFRSLFDDDYPKLDSQTRVVYQVTKKESSVSANSVDVTSSPFVVYISGNDEHGKLKAVSRSDVNMIAVINPNTHQILLVSIPRDSYVPLHTSKQYDKLTHSGMYGMDESIGTIEDLLDEQINYYGRLNFTSFIKVVDALGGVTIYSPSAFTTRIGHYKISKGWNTLNAKKALSFVRERHSFADGDFARNRNQQRMFSAILKKVTSPSIITSFSGVLDAVSNSCETNLSSSEINALVSMQLSNNKSWDIESFQITGAVGTEPCYSAGNQRLSVVKPYATKVKEAKSLIDQVMAGKKVTTDSGDLDRSDTAN